MTYLWKVTAKRMFGKIAQGMWVEIVIANNSRKPTSIEIANALNAKYGVGTAPLGISISLFDIERM